MRTCANIELVMQTLVNIRLLFFRELDKLRICRVCCDNKVNELCKRVSDSLS